MFLIQLRNWHGTIWSAGKADECSPIQIDLVMYHQNFRSSADPDDCCAQIDQIGCALADDRRSAACRPIRRILNAWA